CHVNFDNLVNISKMKKVRGLPKLKKPDNIMCKQCQLGKMTKSSFKSKTYTSKEVLELVHTDLCGPIEVQSYKGDKDIMLFVDDYSRMMTIMFLKKKSDAFQMFKWYVARVEKEIGKSLKCLRSIYMEQPQGFLQDSSLVCHLRKSLYSLKQAPWAWYAKMDSFLLSFGFTRCHFDRSWRNCE
ncbi:reverse transcriptase domain-containing protein, partial [Enterobacter hormaechei]|uniref:GAG-pre-integrase domain-containing protein n=1 Tax=Enterobacter hormaechei TaxID=158836 RepID=UPI0023E3BAD4